MPYKIELESLHPEDRILINHVLTAIRVPAHKAILNVQLSQAEQAGWTNLAQAIRQILEGERGLACLGELDREEEPIVLAILERIQDKAEAITTTPIKPEEIDGRNYLESVRSQYENYPYPKRDPALEKNHLYVTSTEHLGKINHYCFQGKRDLRQSGRFLVAGGGTGDAAIYLAEQLRNTNAEVIYVDLSARSMEIAKQRAAARGLNNISWHQISLLDLDRMNLGLFDFINCCGVLHHLADPLKGLKALSRLLKDDGCMAIMVYAEYGRTAIYQIQKLMKFINEGEQDFQQCISNTHQVLRNLPSTNWYKRDEHRWRDTINDFGDIEVFDLFLHSQDRAYTVPEVYEFVAGAELNLISFTGFTGRKLDYEISKYLENPELLQRLSNIPPRQKQAIAELLNGCVKTHTFYVSKTDGTLANIENRDLVPYFTFKFISGEALYSDLARNPAKSITISLGSEVDPLVIRQNNLTRFILRYIDGISTTRKILVNAANMAKSHGIDAPETELFNEIKRLFDGFFSYELMYLRHYTVSPYKLDYQLGA